MNPPLDQTDALTQLKLLTSQTANFTFTDDEINQALQAAWNDPYVVNVVWDSTTTYTDGTWQYAVPSTMDVVRGIYTSSDTTANPDPLSSDLYEVVNGNIQFRNDVRRWLTSGQVLYIKGLAKLSEDDQLDTTNQVNYVINLAAELMLNNLVLKRSFQFLRNDTTMTDIVRALQVVQGNVLRYKQAILREFESA